MKYQPANAARPRFCEIENKGTKTYSNVIRPAQTIENILTNVAMFRPPRT